ncbi:MAG TPA: hypothetical protein VK543_14570 [Puia sp.]|nr:hypothetical protein [Puia sp.]
MSKEGLTGLSWFGKPVIIFLFLLTGCQQKKGHDSKDISILWKDGRATGFSISRSSLDNTPDDSLRSEVQVKLAGHGEQPAIAGKYTLRENELIFEPLIPFTRGLNYEILLRHQLLAKMDIPRSEAVPTLLAIYPSRDDLPENLLKIYLLFSRPMLEGRSLQYIKLTDQQGDSLPYSFLHLPSELWNEEGTMLTLWLDPGRIKRALQPNKSMGPPLTAGRKYHLLISADWPDRDGNLLPQGYAKQFVAVMRDTISPSPDHWKISIPAAATTQPLQVDLGESLDYALLQDAIRLVDAAGNTVTGTVRPESQETKYVFRPEKPWLKGNYKLQIDPRLEDLAGNNLNRLFDVDLTNGAAAVPAKKIFERQFEIR